ncbi:MAG: phage major capsid protein [Clostridia bacterium]|nr:phage major capsid protein [Clostridia bacterium]
MNKKMRELLAQINAKKAEIKNLVDEGKIEEAKNAKNDLKALQDKWNLLADIEDDEHDDIEDQIESGRAKNIGGDKKPEKKDIVRAFVNRIVCGLRKKKMDDADAEIMNAMTEGAPDEDGLSDGGFTVPEDIQNDIVELRRTTDDLSQYVNVEPVTTKSGSRVIEVDADSTPWNDVDEEAEFGEEETPKFKQVKYEIKKKGGILKVTRELLADTAANILAYLNKWIAKKSRATRNAAILAAFKKITTGKEVAISGFDTVKDIFNTMLDPAIEQSSIVLMNQNGFNYFDKLKDEFGNYIMQKNPTQPTQMLFLGKYPVVKLSNKTLKSDGDKHPVYFGDPKEAITLFDREKMTIELSTEAGDLWAKDMTGIKVRDRFDVQTVDESAVVCGIIDTAAVATVDEGDEIAG